MPDDSLASPYNSLGKPIEVTQPEPQNLEPLKTQVLRNLGVFLAIPAIGFFLIISLFFVSTLSTTLFAKKPEIALFAYLIMLILTGYIFYSKYGKHSKV